MWFVLVINWTGCMSESLESKGVGSFNFKQHSPKYQAMEVSNKYICVQWERLVFFSPLTFSQFMLLLLAPTSMHNDDCRKAVHRSNAPSLGSWAGSNDRMVSQALRSTCGGRCWGRLHRIPAWWSTSAGRWTGRPGWSRRSRRSTCAQGEQWSTEEEKIKYYLQTQSVVLKGSWTEKSKFSWSFDI